MSIFKCKSKDDSLAPVDCIANLGLPVPPGVVAGTRFIVTGLGGVIHPTWINLPAGLSNGDIIQKDCQNLNWLLAEDLSKCHDGGGGLIVWVICKCLNYWYDPCDNEWKPVSSCGDIEVEALCATADGQTMFPLLKTPKFFDKTILTINGVDYVYGENYIITGSLLTWLNDPFEIEICDVIEVRYC